MNGPANDDAPPPWQGRSIQDQLGGIQRTLTGIYGTLGWIAVVLLVMLWRIW